MAIAAICICDRGGHYCDGKGDCVNKVYEPIKMAVDVAYEFSELNLKSLRKLKKVSLKQVEIGTGISNAYLSQLETGKIKNPSFKTVSILLKYYGFKIQITKSLIR